MFIPAARLILDAATLATLDEVHTAVGSFADLLIRVRPGAFFHIRGSNDFETVLGAFLRADPDHPAAYEASHALAACRLLAAA